MMHTLLESIFDAEIALINAICASLPESLELDDQLESLINELAHETLISLCAA